MRSIQSSMTTLQEAAARSRTDLVNLERSVSNMRDELTVEHDTIEKRSVAEILEEELEGARAGPSACPRLPPIPSGLQRTHRALARRAAFATRVPRRFLAMLTACAAPRRRCGPPDG